MKKILLVDDDPNNLLLLRQMLKEYYQLIFAPNGEKALEAAVEHHPDLILLDIMMSGVDGFEVLRRVRADEPLKRIPIVILSSSDEEKDVANAYDLGANSYVKKPLDFGGLVNIFKQLRLYWVFINKTPK